MARARSASETELSSDLMLLAAAVMRAAAVEASVERVTVRMPASEYAAWRACRQKLPGAAAATAAERLSCM